MVTAFLGLWLLVGAPQTTPSPEGVDARALALIDTAKELFAERRYAEAIARFHESQAISPRAANLYNVGKCHERLGEVATALRWYREYLRLEPTARDDQALQTDLQTTERGLAASGVQQVMVMIEPPSARVTVDGKETTESPAYVELTPGVHELTATADGYQPTTRSFAVDLWRADEVRVTLDASPPPPSVSAGPADAVPSERPRPPAEPRSPPGPRLEAEAPSEKPLIDAPTPTALGPSRRTWALVSAGAAVACGIAGAVSGFLTLELAAQARTAADPRLHADRVAMTQTSAAAADVFYGAAVIAAGVATWLFISDAVSKSTPSRPAPLVSLLSAPGVAVLVLTGGW